MSELKKYARYSLNGNDMEWMMEVTDYREEDEDWIRITEIVELVEPALLPASEVNPQKIAAIDEQIKSVRADMNERIAHLEEARQKLMAITHQELPDLDPEGTLKAQDDLSAEGDRV